MKNLFKKHQITYLSAVLVSGLILLSSCGDDDESPTNNAFGLSKLIIGSWSQTHLEAQCSISNPNSVAKEECFICREYNFKSDGTFSWIGFTSAGPTSESVGTPTYSVVSEEYIRIGGTFYKVNISGNELTWEWFDDECTIIETFVRK